MGVNDEPSRQQSLSWLRRLGRLLSGRRRALSERELQAMIEESEEEGLINEEEGEMLASIFEFGETIVREVMVPRTAMVCCPVDASMAELIDIINRSGHSRFPIFEGTTDRIIGVVHAKDLLRFWGRAPDAVSIREVMRQPFFVPETKKIEELLKDFRTRRVHLAIAVDEYGGTSGLITIEDLIEEIVGDIQDEHDFEMAWIEPAGEGAYIADARVAMADLEEQLDLDIDYPEEVDSLGGLLCHLCGSVPTPGQVLYAGPLRFRVLEADERKVSRVRLEMNPEQGSDS
ncbi:MAG: HlyC/CorC family transporter [Deltaproteobacteria bacterium]|nr:MAG: HlyC/CorC family transporter [Deltaproteobacteria bacterium]